MSIAVMTEVWQRSAHSGTELLMLLALADFSDGHGNSYPAVGTLAMKCRMSARNANLLLAKLRESGELEIRLGAGPRGTNAYRIRLGSEQHGLKPASPLPPVADFTPEAGYTLKPASAPPEAGFPKPLKPATDKPSLNRQEPEKSRAKHSSTDRGSRLPSDCELAADWQSFAEQHRPDLDPVACFEGFKDYWLAAPGAKGRKADWFATWRNWVRNQRATAGTPERRPALDSSEVFRGAL